MKTNVKIPRNPPAIALITPDDISLNYFCRGKEITLSSSDYHSGLHAGMDSKLSAILNQSNARGCRLIIVLSAQLTLYSQQEFPPDLSQAQIGELLKLQLLNRCDSGEINTFYDYFLLKKTESASTYGLIEARKDILGGWMSIFELHGLNSVAIVSQPIVLINHMLKNFDNSQARWQIVCLLPSRMVIAYINQKRLEKITEHVTSDEICHSDSMTELVMTHLGGESPTAGVPTLVLDTIDCGIVEAPGKNIRIFAGFDKEKVPGEITIKWLRADHDTYESVALA